MLPLLYLCASPLVIALVVILRRQLFVWPLEWLLGRLFTRMGRQRRQQVRMLLQDGGQCLAFSYSTRSRGNPRHKKALETYHRRLRPIAPSVLPAPTQEDHI